MSVDVHAMVRDCVVAAVMVAMMFKTKEKVRNVSVTSMSRSENIITKTAQMFSTNQDT